MVGRRTFSLVNVAVMAGTLAVWFFLPAYSLYAVYGFVVWMFVGLGLLYATHSSRPVGTAGAGPGGGPGPVPIAAASATPDARTAAPPITFCVFCAADLTPGEARCPACGHAVLFR